LIRANWPGRESFWTAPAKRSGDGAFERMELTQKRKDAKGKKPLEFLNRRLRLCVFASLR
jgi:hypothetical protein